MLRYQQSHRARVAQRPGLMTSKYIDEIDQSKAVRNNFVIVWLWNNKPSSVRESGSLKKCKSEGKFRKWKQHYLTIVFPPCAHCHCTHYPWKQNSIPAIHSRIHCLLRTADPEFGDFPSQWGSWHSPKHDAQMTGYSQDHCALIFFKRAPSPWASTMIKVSAWVSD